MGGARAPPTPLPYSAVPAASGDEEIDEDEDVLGETWSTETEETSSSDSASSNEIQNMHHRQLKEVAAKEVEGMLEQALRSIID